MIDRPEYRELQSRLARGWNTWNTRSLLCWVKLPSAIALNLGVKSYCGGEHVREFFVGQQDIRLAGHAYDGWGLPVYHCRASDKEVRIQLTVPKQAAGTLRMYLIDPDNFQGGRRQEMFVVGKSMGVVESFQKGVWLEYPVRSDQTDQGKVLIQAVNGNPRSNAVISIVEWVQRQK